MNFDLTACVLIMCGIKGVAMEHLNKKSIYVSNTPLIAAGGGVDFMLPRLHLPA